MKQILVIDADDIYEKKLDRALQPRRAEWKIALVTDGDAALALLEIEKIDVVVVDLKLRCPDGSALLSAIHARWPGIVRIVLTSATDAMDTLRFLPFTHQPVPREAGPEVLIDTIDRASNLLAFLWEESIGAVVREVGSLPAMPQSYSALVRVISSEASIRDIARIVEKDPAICATVLHVANSPVFRRSRAVSDVAAAASVLGLNVFRTLVLSTETFRAFKLPPIPGFSEKALQEHALLTAGIARRLVADRGSADDAFVAGLLHDVGKLVLAAKFPRPFARALERAKRDPRPTVVHEKEAVGADHAQIGGYLLSLWGLPAPILRAVAFHHRPMQMGAPALDLLGAVHVADALAAEHGGPSPQAVTLGAPSRMDVDFLSALGIGNPIPTWREIAAEEAKKVATE